MADQITVPTDSDNQQSTDTKPRFDFQSAEPLKSVPQLSTNRSAKYQRPLSDLEKGQVVSDIYDLEHGKKDNILESAVKGEQRTINLGNPDFKAGVDILFGGGILNMVRGIATGKEHPQPTGNIFHDLLNYAHDNAMHGLFEPETNDVTSVALMKRYPGMNYGVAAALGTTVEFGSMMLFNPVGTVLTGMATLSKELQSMLLFNKITQSPQWGDNVMSAATKAGVPWQNAHQQAQRHLWDAISKGNYFQVLMKNVELYKPFQLRGFTTEDVSGSLNPESPGFQLKPTVKSKDKTEIGIDHEEALKKLGMSKNTHVEGKDFQAGFTTPEGKFITRAQAMKPPYNLPNGHSQDIPQDKREKAVHSDIVAPYELPDEITPQKFVKMRIDYLQNQSDAIDAQMRDLEEQKKRLEKNGLTTARIEKKLDKLGTQWQYIDSQIAEHIIGQNKVDQIKNDVGQSKIKDLIDYEATSEDKGYGEGFRRGVTIGKDQGRIKEAQRQSELRTFSKYKQNAKDEANKLSKQIKDLNTNLLPFEYKKMVDDLIKEFDLNKRTAKTLWKRGQTKKYLEDAKARGEEVNIPEKILEMLEKIPLNDMTVMQVRDLHEAVMRLYGQGRLKNILKVGQEERNLENTAKQGVDVITKGKGLSPESQIVKMVKQRDANFAKMTADNLKHYIMVWRRPEAMINQLDNGEQGISTKVIWDPINQADNVEQGLREASDKQIADIFSFQKPERYSDKFNIGGHDLTKSDLMTIYASSGNPENRAHVLAMGFKDDIFDQVDKILSDQEKLAIKKYWQMQNDRFPAINRKAYDTEGRELTQVEKRFPIINLVDKTPDEEMESEYQYRKILAQKNPSMSKNFLKERTGSDLPLRDLNFFGTIYRDMDRQNHYLAYVDAVKNVNKYLKHPDIKQAISQHKGFGENYYDILTKWLRHAAVGRIPLHTDVASKMARFVRTRSVPAYLGGNFETMAKQLIGLLPGMEMAGKSATIAFMPKFMLNPAKYFKRAMSKSTMMKYRATGFGHQEREFEELRQTQDAMSRLHTGLYDKLIQASYFPTRATDMMISNVIWNAVYENPKLKDLSEEDKIKEADRVVRRTQPMGGLIHLPDIFRESSEAAKAITALKGHTNKFFNLEQDMFANKANGKDSNAKFASQFLMYTMLPLTGIFYIQHKRLPKGLEWLSSLGAQEFIGVFGLENLFDMMREHHYSSSTFIESYLQKVYSVFMAKKPSTKLKNAAELAAISTGVPVTGAERIIKAVTDKDPEALFGQSDDGPKKRNKLSDRGQSMFQRMTNDFDKDLGYVRKSKRGIPTE